MAKQQPKRTKDNTAWNISALEKEKNELTVKQNNPKRLSEINYILDYFNWGINKKNERKRI